MHMSSSIGVAVHAARAVLNASTHDLGGTNTFLV